MAPIIRTVNLRKVYRVGDEKVVPILNIDGIVSLPAVNTDFVDSLLRLAPFGAGNPEPRLMLPHARVAKADLVGSGHVRCILGSAAGGRLKAMAFRAADTEMGRALLAGRGEMFTLTGVFHKDSWQGRTGVQFIIDDAVRG